jgi:hypothetical protein
MPGEPGHHRRVRLHPRQFGQRIRGERRAHDRRVPRGRASLPLGGFRRFLP